MHYQSWLAHLVDVFYIEAGMLASVGKKEIYQPTAVSSGSS